MLHITGSRAHFEPWLLNPQAAWRPRSWKKFSRPRNHVRILWCCKANKWIGTEEGNAQYGLGQKLCTVCRDPLSRRDMYEYEYHPLLLRAARGGQKLFFFRSLVVLRVGSPVFLYWDFFCSLRVLVMWWGG